MAPTMSRRSIAAMIPMALATAAMIPNQLHSDIARAQIIRAAFAKAPRGGQPRRDLSSKRGKKRRRV